MNHILRCYGYDVVKTNIVRAQGCYLFDTLGTKYLDLESGVWCTALGHNHPSIKYAIQKQLEKISHIGYRYTNEIVEEAALVVLNSIGWHDGKCSFLSSGSEAVELSVQIGKCITQKPKLLTLSDSYLSAYGSTAKKNPVEWHCFDWSVCQNCKLKEECNLSCKYLNEIPFEEIGGFIFEPGNSSGLINFPPKNLIKNLVSNIRQHQGLVIIDEVTTGLGRTGMWYGFQHYDIIPDIIALGKGLGNGYPVSAVVMTNDIAEQLEKDGFHYAQSHQNDPMGCAIAKEVIKVISENNLVEKSNLIGKYFLFKLKKITERHNTIKEVRSRGLMTAIEFQNDSNCFSLESVFNDFLTRGFIVGYKPAKNLLRFYPPLIIDIENATQLIANLENILNNKRN